MFDCGNVRCATASAIGNIRALGYLYLAIVRTIHSQRLDECQEEVQYSREGL